MKKKDTKLLRDLKKIALLVKVGGSCLMVFFESKKEKKKALKAIKKGSCVHLKNYDEIDPSVYEMDKKIGFTACDLKGVALLYD